MKTKIIALTGAKTVGKTTTARALKTRLVSTTGARCHILSFADPIRDMIRAMGVDKYYLQTANKEKPIDGLGGHSVRTLLQTLGTDWGRETVSREIWIWAMRKKLEAITPGDVAIIDDCRFDNEAELVNAIGGEVWHLTRLGIEYGGDHASEKPIEQTLCAGITDCDDLSVAVDTILGEC